MKTRNFVAKSITSIVNLDRYPGLIHEIFNDHLKIDQIIISSDSNQLILDNNKIHGILEVLNSLIDKHNIFKYIQFDLFLSYLEPLIELKQCVIFVFIF